MPHHVVCHGAYSGCFRTLRNNNESEAFRIVVGRLQGYSSLLLIQWFRVCASVGQEWGYGAFVSSCSPRWVYCLLTDVGQSSYIRTDAWPANTHKQEEDVANTHFTFWINARGHACWSTAHTHMTACHAEWSVELFWYYVNAFCPLGWKEGSPAGRKPRRCTSDEHVTERNAKPAPCFALCTNTVSMAFDDVFRNTNTASLTCFSH